MYALDLRRPFHGARMRQRAIDPGPAPLDESPRTREARLLRAEIERLIRALQAIASPGWFVSHVAAAVWWGLPVPLRLLRTCTMALDVSVIGARRAPRGRGMHGRQLSPALVTVRTHRGVEVASPASVWAQLAPQLSVLELIELGDAIVYVPRRRGMARGVSADALGTIDQLEAALHAGRRQGAARLRAALPSVRVGAASPAETRIRVAAASAGLPELELDVDVFARDGAPIGFTELAHPEYHLLYEYEGDHHRTDRAQWNRDIAKHAACVAAGWEVVRLTSMHAYPSAAPAVARMREALGRAGWRP